MTRNEAKISQIRMSPYYTCNLESESDCELCLELWYQRPADAQLYREQIFSMAWSQHSWTWTSDWTSPPLHLHVLLVSSRMAWSHSVFFMHAFQSQLRPKCTICQLLAQQLQINHMGAVTPLGPHADSHAANRWRGCCCFFLIDRWVVQWLWVMVRVSRWQTVVCRQLSAPINISLMVCDAPVGIDPCFDFSISFPLDLYIVLTDMHALQHMYREMVTRAQQRLNADTVKPVNLPRDSVRHLLLLSHQPTALWLFVKVTHSYTSVFHSLPLFQVHNGWTKDLSH